MALPDRVVVDQRDIQKLGGRRAKYPTAAVVDALLRPLRPRCVLETTYGVFHALREGRLALGRGSEVARAFLSSFTTVSTLTYSPMTRTHPVNRAQQVAATLWPVCSFCPRVAPKILSLTVLAIALARGTGTASPKSL